MSRPTLRAVLPSTAARGTVVRFLIDAEPVRPNSLDVSPTVLMTRQEIAGLYPPLASAQPLRLG